MYELRAIKSPKHVLEAHQGAVTCIAEQSPVKVGSLCTEYIETLSSLFYSVVQRLPEEKLLKEIW